MGVFIKVPLDEVQVPKSGMMVIENHWWLVDDDHVLGFKLYGMKSKERPSPQCSTQKSIIDIALKRKPNQEAVFLPIAYWWQHECDC
jgi:hypothetical protein